MLRTFETISPHLKFRSKPISIDNLAFKFHYRATFIMLLVCTILVTSRQYIGEHIRCMTGGNPTIPEHVINTFCFFTTTFTVVRHLNETQLQMGHIPHPGVGPMYQDDEIKRHAYYQWVPFILFLQALCFYAPHFIWRTMEKGKMKTLVAGMQMIAISHYVNTNEDLKLSRNYTVQTKISIDKKAGIIKREFLRFYENILINKFFAPKLILCELLCLANLLLQIYFTNRFLGGQFYSLGIKFIQDDFKGEMDILDIVFPKVTKCLFYKYGASGSIQKHDALCVMALNVINEKIYTFLWFWFLIVLIITVLNLLWRLLTIILHSRTIRFNGLAFAMASPGRLNPQDIKTITQNLNYSNWLFLNYLASNMDPSVFHMIFTDVAQEIRHQSSSYKSSKSGVEEENSENEAIDQVDIAFIQKNEKRE